MKFEVCALLATLAQVVNAVEKEKAWCNNEAEDGAMSFLGSTKFESTRKPDKIKIDTFWAFTEPNTQYKFLIMDDNEPDCLGTTEKVITQEFKSNFMGFGGFTTKERWTLNGPDSIVGKWLALTTPDGKTDACCRIMSEELDNWEKEQAEKEVEEEEEEEEVVEDEIIIPDESVLPPLPDEEIIPDIDEEIIPDIDAGDEVNNVEKEKRQSNGSATETGASAAEDVETPAERFARR